MEKYLIKSVGALVRKRSKLPTSNLKHYTKVHRNPPPPPHTQQIVQMAFCDLSHTFNKQVTHGSHYFLSSYCGEFCVFPLKDLPFLAAIRVDSLNAHNNTAVSQI